MKCLIILAVVVAACSAQAFRRQQQPQRFRQPQQPFAAASANVFARAAPARPATFARPAAPPAARAGSDQTAQIVRYESDSTPDGGYSYSVETDNGIVAQAQGTPRDFGGNPPLVPVVSQGSYGYTSPEGQPISITYIADENGYQPQGDALPTSPPVPADIARALEYLSRFAPPVQRKK